MAGIYIHIPFCKVKCSYCDFYKTTKTNKIDEFIKAVKLEMWLRRDYLNGLCVETIYFGGGTPSLLSPKQIFELITACNTVFNVIDMPEVTIETNPDDISIDYLRELKRIGVNRISIGVQSLANSDLKLMKRRHNSSQAISAIILAKESGFNNICVDLIYGIPGMSFQQWQKNLKEVFQLDIQHVSAYHLTYHEKTSLGNDLKRGLISEVDENESLLQFEELVTEAKKNNFLHYEISNFAKDNFFSKHNTSYWKQTEYLGLGPSAHSYNKVSRQWNVANLTNYIRSIQDKKIPCEIEELTIRDRFNEYVITSIRTMWGINLKYVNTEFGLSFSTHLYKNAEKYLINQQLVVDEEKMKISQKGMFISDLIMSDLILV